MVVVSPYYSVRMVVLAFEVGVRAGPSLLRLVACLAVDGDCCHLLCFSLVVVIVVIAVVVFAVKPGIRELRDPSSFLPRQPCLQDLALDKATIAEDCLQWNGCSGLQNSKPRIMRARPS